MLLYYCAEKKTFAKLRKKGLKKPATLWTDWTAACTACPAGKVLVIERKALNGISVASDARTVEVPSVPATAFLNLAPFRPMRPVIAGGGYVMRASPVGPEVLMIHRRGVWDLPKGKQDPGETPEGCALREVREEVGIKHLTLVRPLGTTIHGYTERRAYRVKTTYWYAMQTTETMFIPQASEQIDEVAWMPWAEAKAVVGYDSLREHMETIEARGWLPNQAPRSAPLG